MDLQVAFALPLYMPTLALPLYWAGLLSIGGYLAVLGLQNLVLDRFPVDLKKKYKATWALVTGASSGQKLQRRRCARQQGLTRRSRLDKASAWPSPASWPPRASTW